MQVIDRVMKNPNDRSAIVDAMNLSPPITVISFGLAGATFGAVGGACYSSVFPLLAPKSVASVFPTLALAYSTINGLSFPFQFPQVHGTVRVAVPIVAPLGCVYAIKKTCNYFE